MEHDAQEFWTIANEAIQQGLITKKDATDICRPGTRKQCYWGAHVRNLKQYIEFKKKEQERCK